MSAELLRSIRIAPSLLIADHARLGSQVDEVLAAGARVVHVDVMDGHFVPPITVGPLIVRAITEQVRAAGAMIDAHLMIEAPERQIEEFADAGAALITIHLEAAPEPRKTLQAIRSAGALAGLALKPGTPPTAIEGLGEDVDVVLCMTVEPGASGQAFVPSSPEKVAALRARLPDQVVIEVDGGIGAVTGRQCVDAGATLLVAASAVYGQPDPGAAYAVLAETLGAA